MSNRIRSILSLLKARLDNNFVHIVLLCEVGESLKDFEKFAEVNRYEFYSVPYNASPYSLHYVIIHQPNINIDYAVLPLTCDGKPISKAEFAGPHAKLSSEQKELAFGDAMPKSMLTMGINFEGYECIAYLVHLGKRNSTRRKQTRKIIEYMKNAPDINKILLGDFNCLDARSKRPVVYDDQLDLLRKTGWIQRSHNTCTHWPYPFDIYSGLNKEEQDEYRRILSSKRFNPDEFRTFCERKGTGLNEGTALDHVFTKGMDSCNIRVEPESTEYSRLSDHSILTIVGTKK